MDPCLSLVCLSVGLHLHAPFLERLKNQLHLWLRMHASRDALCGAKGAVVATLLQSCAECCVVDHFSKLQVGRNGRHMLLTPGHQKVTTCNLVLCGGPNMRRLRNELSATTASWRWTTMSLLKAHMIVVLYGLMCQVFWTTAANSHWS